MNKTILRFAPILFLAGCSTIDYSTSPPADFTVDKWNAWKARR